MKIIRKRDKIRSVRECFSQQYKNFCDDWTFASGEPIGPIRLALAKLNLETCSSNDVDRALGTTGWVSNCCDECGGDFETLVRFGEGSDYEERWQDLCHMCLVKAILAIEPLLTA